MSLKEQPETILIPASEFQLGAGDDAHLLFVPAFYMAKYPVTNGAYLRFVEATGHRAPLHWRSGFPEILSQHPVVNVSWSDALAYCRWLSESMGQPYRLPTEAEWEKAARGVLTPSEEGSRIYPWGDSFDKTKCNCWEAGCGWTTPVNKYQSGASPYGIMDLVGNVWEWCNSLYADYPYCADDGREALEADGWRVLRGGSWFDYEWGLRATRRLSSQPNHVSHNTGFRVVRKEVTIANK